ncbi:Clavaminate synthase-like protein, partial [Sporormia fimetaria CBS 119925]
AISMTSSLPIIDISPFLTPQSSPSSRQATATAINDACTNFGFFYLTGHGISTETLDHIIHLARQFFALPQEEKNRIKRHPANGPGGGDGARGYQGMGENVTEGRRDMHEAVDWYAEWEDEGNGEVKEGGKQTTYDVLKGPNLWPESPQELKQVYLDYISRLKEIGTAVVRAMGVALNLPPKPENGGDGEDEEVFVRATENSFWVMRMIGYPPLPYPSASNDDLDSLSCGAHTDYGCITLLRADATPGALQVLHKDGKTWIDADPIPGGFVVNIGDMIERWTNGLWKSTLHRVIHRGKGYRVSAPFFFEPGFDVRVKPLEKCVESSGGEGRFGEVVYGEHLMKKIGGNFVGGAETL